MAQGDLIAQVDNVSKRYQMGDVIVDALKNINIDFEDGDFVSIMGPSGCGKSTLMNLLGCLDQPTEGRYLLGGQDVSKMEDDELSAIRGSRLGFVFQSYNLIQQLSVVENIEVPLYYQGHHEAESRERAIELAEQVGLGDRIHHKPYELSGGQQQRVGIARSLANDPLVILADEPTGNLDSKSGADIMNFFDKLHDQGKTLIMVTHSDEMAERSLRIIRLRDGVIESDERKRN